MRLSAPWLLACFLGAWAGMPCSAATIRGTVMDPSGGAVAAAKVKIKHEGTGVARSAGTNPAGIFSFTDLAVGGYQVEVAAAGFKTSVFRFIRRLPLLFWHWRLVQQR